jgi:GAF domain-containing protein
MSTLQRALEHLLLVSDASRALLQLRQDQGPLAITAEAVRHGRRQLRHAPQDGDASLLDALNLGKTAEIQDDAPALNSASADEVTTRMRAPLLLEGKLVGVISLHYCGADQPPSSQDRDELERAQVTILDDLQKAGFGTEALRLAAIQAVLDELRTALDVQRCTFRQPVEEAYAFPVTFESRATDQRSLLGDFTIVQTGQPVIVKLLAERAQVIQEDCNVASHDPLFHRMLAHYGGMRAQMVTPFIVGDELKGVLSVHELRDVRHWTTSEKGLAIQAAALIGALVEVS